MLCLRWILKQKYSIYRFSISDTVLQFGNLVFLAPNTNKRNEILTETEGKRLCNITQSRQKDEVSMRPKIMDSTNDVFSISRSTDTGTNLSLLERKVEESTEGTRYEEHGLIRHTHLAAGDSWLRRVLFYMLLVRSYSCRRYIGPKSL